jgi:very-short-patch-repair endonuclease
VLSVPAIAATPSRAFFPRGTTRGAAAISNVGITRARQRVEVVSSVRAEDFPAEISSEGIRHLHRYLQYAASGEAALALEIGETGADAESPFEEEVIRVIRSWGYDVVPQVGAAGYRIDIGIRHPVETGRYALGVECDGAMYHSSRVARDRDRLRQEVLEGLGWRLHRIWGTSWYRDRTGEEQRLLDAISTAISSSGRKQRQRRRAQVSSWQPETYEVVAPDERPVWADVYAVAQPTPPSSLLLQMHDPAAQADIRRMIEEVVAVEGPVATEVVLRRVREAWQLGRSGARVREAFDRAVSTLKSRGKIATPERGFIALPGSDPAWVRVPDRDAPATRRSVDEVPANELRAAIEHLVEDSVRAGRDELTFAVARLYGWNRRGSEISAALERAVTYLLRMKRLERDGDYLRIATS